MDKCGSISTTSNTPARAVEPGTSARRLSAGSSAPVVERFGPPRDPATEVLPRHHDLAASVQAVLEDAYLAS